MSTLGKAVIEFSADTAKFTGDVGRAAALFTRNMERMEAGVANIRNALAAAAGLGGFGLIIQSALDTGDQLHKLSQKVGISVESLSELKLGAELADLNLEALTLGLKEFNKSLTEAGDGNSKAAQIFKQLGVDIQAGPEAALRQFADAMSKLPDGATKTTVALEIMGKAGTTMIPWLNGGADGMDRAAQSARNLGLVMSAKFARDAEQFNDNLKLLGRTTDALGIQFGGKIIEGLVTLTTNMVKAAEKGEKWMGILREINKLLLANASLVPGWIGWAADQGATRAFADNEGSKFGPRVGLITGPDGKPINTAPAAPALNPEAVACAASGGKWEGGRCVRAATGGGSDPFQDQVKRLRQAASSAEFGDSEFIRMKTLLAEDKALKQLSETQKNRLLDLAAEADVQKSLARDAKEREEGLAENAKERSKLSAEEIVRLNQNKAALIAQIDPIQKFRDELEKVRELLKEGFITPEQALEMEFAIQNQIEAVQGLNKEGKEGRNVAHELGLTFSSAFENAVVGGNKLRDVFAGLALDLAKLAVRKTLTEPIAEAAANWFKANGFGGGGGGFFGSILSAVTGAFGAGGSTTIPADVGAGYGLAYAAEGGHFSAGDRVMVGERGPELFVPDVSGTVVPNKALGGGGPVFNVDMRGASVDAVARLERLVMQVNGSIESRAIAAYSGARRRGGV